MSMPHIIAIGIGLYIGKIMVDLGIAIIAVAVGLVIVIMMGVANR